MRWALLAAALLVGARGAAADDDDALDVEIRAVGMFSDIESVEITKSKTTYTLSNSRFVSRTRPGTMHAK